MLLHLYNSPRMVSTSCIPCVPTDRYQLLGRGLIPGQRFLKTEQFLKKNTLKTTCLKPRKYILLNLTTYIENPKKI